VAAVDGGHGCGDAGGCYEAVAAQTFDEGRVCGAVGAPGHCSEGSEGVRFVKWVLSDQCWWRCLVRTEAATTVVLK